MPESKINISLNDIVSVVSLIDITSTRGAFKGQELATVGHLRDRFALFIEQNKKEKEEEELVNINTTNE